MIEINNRLYQNAVKNGIPREKFKFANFKIKDMDQEFVKKKQKEKDELIEKYKY